MAIEPIILPTTEAVEAFASGAQLDSETHGLTRTQVEAGLRAGLRAELARHRNRPHDPLAANVVRNHLVNALATHTGGWYQDHAPENIVDDLMPNFTVAWEHAVNEHGVAARRPVLTGAWEVDPDAVARGGAS